MGGQRHGRVGLSHGQCAVPGLRRGVHRCSTVPHVVGFERTGVVDVCGGKRRRRRVWGAVHPGRRACAVWRNDVRQLPRPGRRGRRDFWRAGRWIRHALCRRWRGADGRHAVWHQQLRPGLLRPNRRHRSGVPLRPKHRQQAGDGGHVQRQPPSGSIRGVFHAGIGRFGVAHPHWRPGQRGECGHQPHGLSGERLRGDLPQRLGRLHQQFKPLHFFIGHQRDADDRRRLPNQHQRRGFLARGDESGRHRPELRDLLRRRHVQRTRGRRHVPF